MYEYKNDSQLNQELHNICSNISNLSNTTATNSTPSGAIFEFGGITAPSGYFSCDGSTASKTTDASLFNAIGTTWNTGGEPAGTFRLPNLQRRTPVGFGGVGTSVLGSTVGALGGEETHVMSVTEMPSHNHTISDPGHTHVEHLADSSGPCQGVAGTPGGAFACDVGTANGAGNTTSGASTGITINNAGSGSAFNQIQPSAVVMFIIKR